MSTTTPDAPMPVRQVVTLIGRWIDRLGVVWVEGQVTQVNRRRGLSTVFLVLRDPLADVSVALTCHRSIIDSLPTPLVEGARIVVQAKPSLYLSRATLSLQVREIRLVGEGHLLAMLEQRRRLLAAEGLFAPELKRPLPFLPRRIGLITAPGSAAERDVLQVARRRWPAARFEPAPATMQGVNCVPQVIEALARLDADPTVDVIIIARGGGSVEDLLPFSDETLVRAVHAATTPVVSAIGHEPDSPILDLVADRRAATPTDAARTVVPDVAEETLRLDQTLRQLRGTVLRIITGEQERLDTLRSRPSLADPRTALATRATEIAHLRHALRQVVRHRVDRDGADLDHSLARIRALSPEATLRRGYAVVADATGAHVTGVAGVAAGDHLTVRLADGSLGVVVEETDERPLPGRTDPTEHSDPPVQRVASATAPPARSARRTQQGE